jgi:hypothetical protein
MVAGMRDLTPEVVLEQFVSSNDGFLDLLAGLDDDGWATLAEAPPGHLPVRLLAHHALWDSWIHERDIALPLGSTPPVEPDEVAASLRYVAALTAALMTGSLTGTFALRATDPTLTFVIDLADTAALGDVDALPAGPCLLGDAATLVDALTFRVPLPADVPAPWMEMAGGLAAVFQAEVTAGG